jgi:hypothetical protein
MMDAHIECRGINCYKTFFSIHFSIDVQKNNETLTRVQQKIGVELDREVNIV